MQADSPSFSPFQGITMAAKSDEESMRISFYGKVEGPIPAHITKKLQGYKPINKSFDIERLHRSANKQMRQYRDSVFYGQVVDGKRHGIGIQLYENGRVYEGDWQCDLKNGVGFEKHINGGTYSGDYKNGKPQGVGTYKWPNGEIYQGQWVMGQKHGSGMWKGPNGDSYIGEWKNGKADGDGVHIWTNGDRYEGEFKGCLKHGEGREIFVNGDIYSGFYENGKPSGFGEYQWANGSYFKGYFKNGLRHGKGVWKKSKNPDADTYEGEYANDKKCGEGTFIWSGGNSYKGSYFNDLRHGYGEMFWSDGSWYRGNWEKGIQHGVGEIQLVGDKLKKGVFENNILIHEIESPEKHKPIITEVLKKTQTNWNSRRTPERQASERNDSFEIARATRFPKSGSLHKIDQFVVNDSKNKKSVFNKRRYTQNTLPTMPQQSTAEYQKSKNIRSRTLVTTVKHKHSVKISRPQTNQTRVVENIMKRRVYPIAPKQVPKKQTQINPPHSPYNFQPINLKTFYSPAKNRNVSRVRTNLNKTQIAHQVEIWTKERLGTMASIRGYQIQ